MHPAGRVGKRRNQRARAKLERVIARTDGAAVGKRSFPGHTKRHTRIAPKTQGTATTADSDTLRPVPAPARAHA